MNRQHYQAQERARIILQVRSGQMTARDGARLLGISRKTYYQWEKRALHGMLSQLTQLPPGRPPKTSHPKVAALQAKIRDLEAKLKLTRQIAKVRGILMDLQRTRDQANSKKKKRKSAKSSP